MSVTQGSVADGAGIRPGDDLVSVAGMRVADSLDLAYALGWVDDEQATFDFVRAGERFSARLPAEGPGELGFELAGDPIRTCGNRCTFCFVDQLPGGLRPSLYVKDEDYRLSFTLGNYVTLTNLSEGDFERIAEQRLSPLYVSVHATDDAVRRRMLGNPDAPPIMPALKRLARDDIRIHAQVVVCPGVNEGAVLERTIADLASLGDSLASLAVVPVGLTAHRDGLPELEPVSSSEAAELLDAVERWQESFREQRGARVVYAADELYLLSGRPLPPLAEYDDLPQIENGVGLLRTFEADLTERAYELGDRIQRPLAVAMVTGELAADFLREAIELALGDIRGLSIEVLEVENEFLGRSVTVAGLLTGRDMAETLAAHPGAELCLLPAAAFNADGLTIDDMTARDIARATGMENIVATDDIVGAILDHTCAPVDSAGTEGGP